MGREHSASREGVIRKVHDSPLLPLPSPANGEQLHHQQRQVIWTAQPRRSFSRGTANGTGAGSDDVFAISKRGPGAMIEVIAVLLFFVADVALVVLALLWLSQRRAMGDVTDLRFRGRRRYR